MSEIEPVFLAVENPYILVEVVDADSETNSINFDVNISDGLQEHAVWLLELLLKKMKEQGIESDAGTESG